MREPRKGRTILTALALIISISGTFVFLGQIFAQEDFEPMPEDDMMYDDYMMDMPGMRPDRPTGLEWSEQPMPEELRMTYDEFLDRTGHPRAMIPDYFLYDEDVPREFTEDQWEQLQRIYITVEVVDEVPTVGRPGYGLATRIQRELAAKEGEIATVRRVYEQGLDNFSFKIGYPQVGHEEIRPGMTSVPLQIGVIKQVRPGVDQRYPSLVYRSLEKFDHYQRDRQEFHIVDYEGGMINPKRIWLYSGAVSEWNSLWQQNSIRVTLYDVEGNEIVSGVQPAGHDGGILAEIVHPHTLNYAPMHETVIPPQDRAFRGGDLNLDYAKGWYYNFSFNIPLATLPSLDRAEAVLIGAGGLEGARGQTSAPPPGVRAFPDPSRAAVTTGVDRATDAARRGVGMSGYHLGPPVYTGVGF